ncbi:hypothetical protein D3C81_2155010 [compost metagenome]
MCGPAATRADDPATDPAVAAEYQAGADDGAEQADHAGQTGQAVAAHLRELCAATGG